MVRMTGYIPTLEQVDELHHRIAPSDAAYDLIHRHCVIVARIARALARRQNALFTRRCSLPTDTMQMEDALPPSDGVIGGKVPPRLIDEHLVVIGGLLHDIGTYRVLKHDGTDGEPLQFNGPEYIKHGLLGYEYLIEQGVAEEIAQFARNHTGVGLTKEDVIRQGLPLPPDDYKPVNLEQELVMVADKYNTLPTHTPCEPRGSARRTSAVGWICWTSTALWTWNRWPPNMAWCSSVDGRRINLA